MKHTDGHQADAQAPSSHAHSLPEMTQRIAENSAHIQQQIEIACANCGRSADEIRVITVTKTQDSSVMSALAANGLVHYGENRIDHAQTMHAEAAHGSTLHCIGRVQSRQLSRWVAIADTLHSVHSIHHVERIARACREHHKTIDIFCQVNTSGEASKAGLLPQEIPEMLDVCAQYSADVQLIGLMCMAPVRLHTGAGNNDAQISQCFTDLYDCGQRYALPRLSMGMSGDFDLAIQAGATDIRIGTRIFA